MVLHLVFIHNVIHHTIHRIYSLCFMHRVIHHLLFTSINLGVINAIHSFTCILFCLIHPYLILCTLCNTCMMHYSVLYIILHTLCHTFVLSTLLYTYVPYVIHAILYTLCCTPLLHPLYFVYLVLYTCHCATPLVLYALYSPPILCTMCFIHPVLQPSVIHPVLHHLFYTPCVTPPVFCTLCSTPCYDISLC